MMTSDGGIIIDRERGPEMFPESFPERSLQIPLCKPTLPIVLLNSKDHLLLCYYDTLCTPHQ